MKIEVDALSFSVGKKRILNGVSARFEGRKIYGIIGPNGSGKTTLLRHLYRQYPANGHVRVDGVRVEQIPRRQYARRIAVMMQLQSFAESELRVSEVVRTGRYPYKKVMMPYDRGDEAILEEVMRETSLWALRDRRVGTLSGGEMQRVMFARCLVQQPEAILLDEPTNHLDIQYRIELMKRLKAFDGMTIMTLHDLNLAARYCDTIYLMKDGTILAEGTPAELLTAEWIDRAFGVRVDVLRRDGEIYIGL